MSLKYVPSSPPPQPPLRCSRSYLTEHIYQLILERQLPHNNVSLLLPLLIETLSRRFCGGVDFLKLINKHIVSDKVVRGNEG